ncbi:unnamed protein product [Durusdinium trenchii]|uniref:OmpA-like domain-containing protein n=2 Tax=Durusdinium trenchii TaxID=1381693 RepID=A0ABP0JPI7_9DINO
MQCICGGPSSWVRLPKLSKLASPPTCWKASASLFRKRARVKPICTCDFCDGVVYFLTSAEGIIRLIEASGDAELLARLGMCNRRLCINVFHSGVERLCVASVSSHAVGLTLSMTFQQMGCGQLALKICGSACGNHIYFGQGGGTVVRKESLPFIRAAANLALRFKEANIHIDAHAGVRAPGRFVAKNCSQARAKAILRELISYGADANRITFTAWGKDISSIWGESDERVARAEVYVQIAGAEFPERPAYYSKAVSGSSSLHHGADEVGDEFGFDSFLHSDPESLMLFLPAATGFQLVSVLNSA